MTDERLEPRADTETDSTPFARRARRLARALRPAALAFAGGVAASWLVACGCALWIGPNVTGERTSVHEVHPPNIGMNVIRYDTPGATSVTIRAYREHDPPSPTRVVPCWCDPPAVPESRMAMVSHECAGRGWPWLAFGWNLEPSPRFRRPHVLTGGLRVEARWLKRALRTPWTEPVIPLRPLWRGLLADAALYGTGLWLLLGLPAAVVRGSRRRRGRCPRCGYDMRHGRDGTCSECGFGAAARAP